MINTILFDLDGTLLPMDVDVFMSNYFKALGKKCAHLVDPKKLPKMILDSTECMVRSVDAVKTNQEVFMEDFAKKIESDFQSLLPVLDEFYKEEFQNLKFTTQPVEIVVEVIKILKEKGYTLVVATNPLFPRQAILHRIQWSGLEENDFSLITDYESMHFCKPNLDFYSEILQKIEKRSEECIMVGNDVQEDIIAEKLGMKTFLIEDNIINRENKEPSPEYRGSYQDLLDFVMALPNLKKE
ncbi:HAD family hydrolase [Geosporobacter ferrireducens]|uniref:Hydrolase n=1 Tax=Geosporobacter ferrireducens TaxID=1424294 RepID=A0A1D8GC95_9FIRM|nr:HAD family hydrolase [Geosporobacter ferrireducens]AOT68502.1 hydrolase [Geosporobacter ferrireducens]MTI53963.1 HAD family hydrolase [Geosporobacter ferrireducens]